MDYSNYREYHSDIISIKESVSVAQNRILICRTSQLQAILRVSAQGIIPVAAFNLWFVVIVNGKNEDVLSYVSLACTSSIYILYEKNCSACNSSQNQTMKVKPVHRLSNIYKQRDNHCLRTCTRKIYLNCINSFSELGKLK